MRRLVLFLTLLCTYIPAQAQNGCPALQAPPPPPNIILTPRQESELGDILAEQLESESQVINDENLTGYLTRIGNAVAAQLPESGLHYQFFLYDQPEIQAFGIPGGRIYVSRKMVAFLKNEDELAGLLGHELGHLVARAQGASMSQQFRNVLGLSSVGENENLFDRYNQVLDSWRLKNSSRNVSREDRGQITADQLGLEAVARAGYAPERLPDLLDRSLETKGNTGSWLSELFGTTRPNSKRLRELLKDLSRLPAGCISRGTEKHADEFAQWQSDVLHYQGIGHREKVSGVALRKVLGDPLRGDIHTFRFSNDGKYLLAQDDGGIYILARDPLKFVFRIDAPDADEAQFSPDSQNVVFFSSRLRVETWDLARQVQLTVADVPTIHRCRQTALSPTARYLACFQSNLTLALFDVGSGQKLLEKEKFFDFDSGLSYAGGFFKFLFFVTHREVVTLRFSPDERYFAASSRTGEDAALDLKTGERVKVSGQLHHAIIHSFTFIKPDVIVGIDEEHPDKSRIAEFPSGKVIDHVPLGETTLFASENPKYVLLRPVIDRPVGVLDLEKKRVVFTGRNSALDVWGEEIASERLNGEIGIYKMGETKADRTAQLPLGNLGKLATAVASPDLRWLAISTRTRGGVWDLSQGHRSLYVRGFQNASYTAGPAFFLDFPEFENLPRDFSIMSPVTKQARDRQIDKGDDLRFFGSTLLKLKTDKKNHAQNAPAQVEALDMALMTPLWNHAFPKGAPGFGGSPESGKIVLAWKARAPGLHEEMLRDTNLEAHIPKTNPNETDYFFQIVNARDGKNTGSVFLSTGKYSFLPEYWNSAGDWLVVTDNQHRVLVYSVASGDVAMRWFGDRPRFSGSGQFLAFENGRGHLLVYDLGTRRRTNEYYFAQPISAKIFSEDGKRLLVLLSDQTVLQLDIGNAAEAKPAK